MIRLLRGELTRLRGTRLPLWSLLIAAVAGIGLTGLIGVVGPENATPPMPGLDTAAGVRTLLGLAGVTLFLPALIGTIAITSEYRHRTIATTFLAAPRRGRVLAAKLIAFGALGLGYGLVLAGGAICGILIGSTIHSVSLGMPLASMMSLAARLAAAAAIYMLLGVAIGALTRHQILAIGLTLGYFYFLEHLLMLVPGLNNLYPVLPGGATSALTRSTIITDAVASQTPVDAPTLLPPVAGAAVLLGYAVIAAVVATVVPLRRDIL